MFLRWASMNGNVLNMMVCNLLNVAITYDDTILMMSLVWVMSKEECWLYNILIFISAYLFSAKLRFCTFCHAFAQHQAEENIPALVNEYFASERSSVFSLGKPGAPKTDLLKHKTFIANPFLYKAGTTLHYYCTDVTKATALLFTELCNVYWFEKSG